MKRIGNIMFIITCLISGFNASTQAQMIYYAGNGGNWLNWDLYSYNIGTSTETRLTINGAIDNHPAISHLDSTRVVFSSDRGNGEFDIYVANIADVDGTAVRLTFDAYPGSPEQVKYPDRHPHWHPNGELIVCTSKNRGVWGPVVVASECSTPIIIMGWRYFEGMNVIRIDAAGNVLGYSQLNVRSAWDSVNDPTIWVHNDQTYTGHPSFNNEGNKMVFTGAIDGEGKNWEVYTCGFDPVSMTLIPNSLERKTFGPNNGNNPIKMSGGAKFTNDDSYILFNSTRITSGNSQIYSIPSFAIDWPVTMATRRTFHQGNDYVPEPVAGTLSDFVCSSDLGLVHLCGCEQGSGPTADLVVVLVQGWNRTILGTDAFQETLLIADEVSWFCGTKPNLSACTFSPRIIDAENAWLIHTANDNLPDDLLAGYGPLYSTGAKQLYSMNWAFLSNNMQLLAPTQYWQMMEDISVLQSTFPVTGFTDPIALRSWYFLTEELRNKKYVVPSVMYYGFGLAGDPFKFPPYDNYLTNIIVPEWCSTCNDAIQTMVTGGNGTTYTMQPGGNVTLIAGINIRLLAGTTIQVIDDRTFHAAITTVGEYCPGSIMPASPHASQVQTANLNDKLSVDKLLFKIYPNPATQSFWVEMLDAENPAIVQVEVYDLSGLKILYQNLLIDNRTQISLSNQPSGIYFVRLTKGNKSGDQIVVLN